MTNTSSSQAKMLANATDFRIGLWPSHVSRAFQEAQSDKLALVVQASWLLDKDDRIGGPFGATTILIGCVYILSCRHDLHEPK